MADLNFGQNIWHQIYADTQELIVDQPAVEDIDPILEDETRSDFYQDPARNDKIIDEYSLPSGVNLGHIYDSDNGKPQNPLRMAEGAVLNIDDIQTKYAPLLFNRPQFPSGPLEDLKLKSNYLRDLQLQTHSDGTQKINNKRQEKSLDEFKRDKILKYKSDLERELGELIKSGISEQDQEYKQTKNEIGGLDLQLNPYLLQQQALLMAEQKEEKEQERHDESINHQQRIIDHLMGLRRVNRPVSQAEFREEEKEGKEREGKEREDISLIEVMQPKSVKDVNKVLNNPKELKPYVFNKNAKNNFNSAIFEVEAAGGELGTVAEFKENFKNSISKGILNVENALYEYELDSRIMNIDINKLIMSEFKEAGGGGDVEFGYPEQLRMDSAPMFYQNIDYTTYEKSLNLLGKTPSFRDKILFTASGQKTGGYMFGLDLGEDGIYRMNISGAAQTLKRLSETDLIDLAGMTLEDDGLFSDPMNFISFNPYLNERSGHLGAKNLRETFIKNLQKRFTNPDIQAEVSIVVDWVNSFKNFTAEDIWAEKSLEEDKKRKRLEEIGEKAQEQLRASGVISEVVKAKIEGDKARLLGKRLEAQKPVNPIEALSGRPTLRQERRPKTIPKPGDLQF